VGITTIYVTHDQMEAFSLSDRVFVLEDGELAQEGAPIDIYESPRSEFVGDFIGRSSELTGAVRSADGRQILTVGDDALTLPTTESYGVGDELTVFLRAEKLDISPTETGRENELEATVTTMNYLGEKTQFFCELPDGEELIVSVQGFTDVGEYENGDTVYVTAAPENLIVAGEPHRRRPKAHP